MHPEPLISDAQYTRSRILELDARRRLIAQATSNPIARHGPRHRLGSMLIEVGSRLQGIAPALTDRHSLPSTIPTVRTAR